MPSTTSFKFKATCHGKIMLAGEYSVLWGGRALAFTTSSEMTVAMTPTSDEFVEIFSDHWGTSRKLSVSECMNSGEPAFSFLGKLLTHPTFPNKPKGLAVEVVSTSFDVSYGVGSSSALRLAMAKAFSALTASPLTREEIILLAYEHQLSEQKRASGYDFLTQAYGGFTVSRSLESKKIDCQKIDPLPGKLSLLVYVSSTGAPTGPLLKSTYSELQRLKLVDELLEASESLISSFLQMDKGITLFSKIARVRSIFKQTGAYSPVMSNILDTHPFCDREYSWKQTGAGGEDALLVFGNVPQKIHLSLLEHGYRLAPFELGDFPLR